MGLLAFLILLVVLFAVLGFLTVKWLLIIAAIALVFALFSGFHTYGGRRW